MSSASKKNDQLIEEYMSRIDHALQDLPRERRDPIIEDIRDHIQTARATLDPEDEAQIRQLLNDLGDPEAIRAEAGLPSIPRTGWGDRLAPWLLLFGGVIFIVGWLAGVVLLWNSSVWRTRDKVLATLVWPGGLAGVLSFGGLWGLAPTCTGSPGLCPPQPGPSVFHVVGEILVLVVVVAAPVVVNARLIRIQRRVAPF